MQQTIVGFHRDEESDWVAELNCGHFQHVRHRPPFINRAWVQHELTRARYIGHALDCKKCDRQEPLDVNATSKDQD